MNILKRIFGREMDVSAGHAAQLPSALSPTNAPQPAPPNTTSPEKGATPHRTDLKGYAVWFQFIDSAAAAQSLQSLRKAKSPFPFQLPHEISHLGGKGVGNYLAIVLQMETAIDECDRVRDIIAAWVTSSGVRSFTQTKCSSWMFPMTTEMLATAIVGSGNIRDRFGDNAQQPRVNEGAEQTGKQPPLSDCGCSTYFFARMMANPYGFEKRCAIVVSRCVKCGAGYWTFLDKTQPLPVKEVCSQSMIGEIRDEVAAEALIQRMIARAAEGHIYPRQIDIVRFECQ
jgi:hypothetical protein